jgi:hypothetical protein
VIGATSPAPAAPGESSTRCWPHGSKPRTRWAATDPSAAQLNDDRDYDTLAEVMAFESVWLAPAGSLP